MKPIRVVYIAGPYRAHNVNGIVTNIARAREVAIAVWKAGLTPLCPHLNSACMDGVVPDNVFLEGDIELLARCDAVLCVPGHGRSQGTRREIAHAAALGIPVYSSIEEISFDANAEGGHDPKRSASRDFVSPDKN